MLVTSRCRPARPPSITSGSSILVQLAAPASPFGHLCEQLQKGNEIIHFHNSCTRNGDYFVLSIKTANAHNERMQSQTAIDTFKKCEAERLKHI